MIAERIILQRNLSRFLVNEVFDTISEDDILRRNVEGKWTLKGAPLTDGQIKLLKKEAEAFKKSFLYTILMDEIRWIAKEKHNKATTEYDIISTNLLSYFTDVVKSKVEKIVEL